MGVGVFVDVFLVGEVGFVAVGSCDPLPAEGIACPVAV